MQAWKANIDIQPVFNNYKTVTYMCACFSKPEDQTSEAIKQAAKEALSGNKWHYEKMKAKIFPKVMFLNSNLPEK